MKKVLLGVFAVVFALSLSLALGAPTKKSVKAAGGLTITKVSTKNGPGGFTSSINGNDSATMTVADPGYDQSENWIFDIYVSVGDTGQKQVNFTLTNNEGSSDLNAKVELHNENDWDLGGVSGGVGGTVSGGKFAIETITAGSSKNVSVIANNSFSGVLRIQLMPVGSSGKNVYIGSLVISDITVGEVQSTPDPEPTEADFKMLGASIRLDEYAGIRFFARLEKDAYNENDSYGMILFPANALPDNAAFTIFDANYNYKEGIETGAADYISAMQTRNSAFTYVLSCDPMPVYVGNTDVVDYYKINGTLSQVLYKNIGRDFFGVAYRVHEGVYTFAEFDDGFRRSVAQVAALAYDDFSAGSEERTALDNFLYKDACYKAGLDADAAETATISLEGENALEIEAGNVANAAVSAKLNATAIEASFTYQSSAPEVATVSESGTISAIAEGEATITVTAELFGRKVEKNITVTVTAAQVVEILTVEVSSAETVEEGKTVTLSPSAKLNGNAVSATFTYASNNTQVANVSNNGVVTAVKEGTAKITVTATYNAKQAVAECAITVTAAQEAPSADIIGAKAFANANKSEPVISGDKKSVTFTAEMGWGGNGQEEHVGNLNVAYDNSSAKTTVTFTITNNSTENDLTLGFAITDNNANVNENWNYRDQCKALNAVPDGTYKRNDKNIYILSVALGKGNSITVTLSVDLNTSYDHFVISTCAFATGGFKGQYTISDIKVG